MSLTLLRRLLKGVLVTPFYIKDWPAFYLIYFRRYFPVLDSYLSKTARVRFRNGIVFTIRPLAFDRYILNEIWIHNDYNPDNRSIKPNDTVIDLGAHLGGFTVYAANHGATVYALEPSPESFALMEKNVSDNNFQKRVTALQRAIGPTKSKVKLYTNTSNPAMNSEIARTDQSITVETLTLASIFEQYKIERCQLLKCDIEGSEYELFYSLPDRLYDRIDRIYLEFHESAGDTSHTPEALQNFLETRHYKVRQFFTYLYATKAS